MAGLAMTVSAAAGNPASPSTPGVASYRLAPEDYLANFADLHPPLTRHQAFVEADRCYFCFDAPCVQACPTSIDIPLFIREILTDTPKEAARTIFAQNILGGMCARVCPVETLCEEACVREAAEGKPVKIGLLQRYATDTLMAAGEQPFQRAGPTSKRVAVVGGGPAGLAAAHCLALHGHEVVIFDARPKAGGLNEYGIAAYKTPGGFAQAEVDYILGIGGITVQHGQALGQTLSLDELQAAFDAVFLAVGLAGVNALGIPGEEAEGVADAVGYIADLRQAADLGTLPVGRRAVVIGGGMTAIDIADQTKRLGADEVTIVYRRSREKMPASAYEQDLALSDGVRIIEHARPVRVETAGGRVTAVVFERTADGEGGRLIGTGEAFSLPADIVFKAIGQTFDPSGLAGGAEKIALEGGRIRVDGERRTSLPGVWAGGDCVFGGKDLTVAAAADGRIAAESIHRTLMAG